MDVFGTKRLCNGHTKCWFADLVKEKLLTRSGKKV